MIIKNLWTYLPYLKNLRSKSKIKIINLFQRSRFPSKSFDLQDTIFRHLVFFLFFSLKLKFNLVMSFYTENKSWKRNAIYFLILVEHSRFRYFLFWLLVFFCKIKFFLFHYFSNKNQTKKINFYKNLTKRRIG